MKNNEMPASFYFHDYETFGADPAFDRPAQFAGVRTDSELNIIEEPLVIYCKPTIDYLPTPEAVLITGITPQKALQQGVCEAEFAQKIHLAFSRPNTCILGYNNIRFDDEVSRNIFYRNFYDPYSYSWQSGSSRWDLLDVVRSCYALRPEGINWPINENGFASFRLEDLTTANNIKHQHAHDAMSDVYATIEIAKLIKQKQPKLFDYFFHLRHKNQVANLIDTTNLTPLVHISGMFGAYRGNTALIVPIAWHPVQTNAVIACDLGGNIEQLLSLTAEQIREKLYTKTEDLDNLESRVPLKLIHLNKCPIVAPIKTLNTENTKHLSIDIAYCLQNLTKIRQFQNSIQEKLLTVFDHKRAYPEDRDVDSQIYQGFFDHYDKSLCDIIRQTAPECLHDLQIKPHDNRLKELFFRYKARNYPQALNDMQQVQWQDYCLNKLNCEVINHYLAELDNLTSRYQQEPQKLALLKALYHWCQYLAANI